jgi:hypothetical protein
MRAALDESWDPNFDTIDGVFWGVNQRFDIVQHEFSRQADRTENLLEDLIVNQQSRCGKN